jgi:hypothetical protein
LYGNRDALGGRHSSDTETALCCGGLDEGLGIGI